MTRKMKMRAAREAATRVLLHAPCDGNVALVVFPIVLMIVWYSIIALLLLSQKYVDNHAVKAGHFASAYKNDAPNVMSMPTIDSNVSTSLKNTTPKMVEAGRTAATVTAWLTALVYSMTARARSNRID